MKKFGALALAAALSVSAISALAAEVNPVHDDFEANGELVDIELEHVGAKYDDVTETGMKLKIYDEIWYRASDIESLQPGDVINCETGYTVETVQKDGEGGFEINGGYENDGLSLWRDDDGTYEPYQADDLGYFDMMREAELPFAEQVTVSTYQFDADGNLMDEDLEQTAAAADVKALLFTDEEDALSPSNTSVTVENGRITRVEIDYEP